MTFFYLILHPGVPLYDFHIFIISEPCSFSGGVFNLRKAGRGGLFPWVTSSAWSFVRIYIRQKEDKENC